MADGEPPHYGKSQAKILLKIVQKDPPTLKDPRWSPLFKDFISKCLIKDPLQRWSADQCMQHEFIKDAERHKDEFIKYAHKMKSIIKNKEIITTNDGSFKFSCAPTTGTAAGQDVSVFEKFDSSNNISEEQYH